MNALLAFVLIYHLSWTYKSSYFDLYHKYSASHDAATYIRNNNINNKEIYLTSKYAVGILPYFQDNFFDNLNNKRNPSYWRWVRSYKINTDILINDRPEYVCYSSNTNSNYLELDNEALSTYIPPIQTSNGKVYVQMNRPRAIKIPEDYKLLAEFQAYLYWKNRIYETHAFKLLKRSGHE